MNVERYSDILEKEKNIMQTSNIFTDFNQGSGIMTLLEAFARITEKFYIDTRNGFLTNLRAIPYQVFKFEKKNGKFATGKATFTFVSPISTTSIPLGTEIKSGDNVYVTTTLPSFIPAGSNEVTVEIRAAEIGSKYNANAGMIDTISSILPPAIVAVTNKEDVTGGIDSESDSEMYNRFNDWINGLSGTNKFGLKSAILSSDDAIRDVNIVEHFPPLNGVNFTLYLDLGNADAITEDLWDKLILAVDGDGTENNPGHKAMGIKWDAKPVFKIDIPIKYSVEIQSTSDNADEEIKTLIQDIFDSYKIGEDVILSTIIARIKSLNYVKDFKILSPLDNVKIPDNSIAKCSSITRG